VILMSEHIDCPYCGTDNNIDDWFDRSDSHCQGEFDIQCTDCLEYFEVTITMNPSFSSCEILMADCIECGRHYRYRHQSFPRPKKYEEVPLQDYKVCDPCYYTAISEEMGDGKDAVDKV